MIKRLIDATSKELLMMNREELLSSIRLSEGRVILSELMCRGALFNGISNVEIASAFGADLLLLNLYDVDKPYFRNIDTDIDDQLIKIIKKYTGRPVGINLEPVDESILEKQVVAIGRKASPENAEKAYQQGADFIVLTGNPSTGVTSDKIVHSIKEIRSKLGNKLIIMAGKMHMAGVEEDYLSLKSFEDIEKAGADVILLPSPGSVPGLTVEECNKAVKKIKRLGSMVMTTIGTSQESSDLDTIRRLAMNCKISGADIHHIGDAGTGGIANPENIMAYSIAIRGIRHTYKRMALSINR